MINLKPPSVIGRSCNLNPRVKPHGVIFQKIGREINEILFTRRQPAAVKGAKDNLYKVINLLAPEFFFLILAHPVYRM